jgi:hypothetical protein
MTYTIEYNPSTHRYIPESQKEKDQRLISDRRESFDDIDGPRVGDFLKTADGTYHRFTHDWGDSIQTTSASYPAHGSFYLGEGYVSYSGGLDPAIDKKILRRILETREGRFWFFSGDSPRAHNGIYFNIPCRVYEKVQA